MRTQRGGLTRRGKLVATFDPTPDGLLHLATREEDSGNARGLENQALTEYAQAAWQEHAEENLKWHAGQEAKSLKARP